MPVLLHALALSPAEEAARRGFFLIIPVGEQMSIYNGRGKGLSLSRVVILRINELTINGCFVIVHKLIYISSLPTKLCKSLAANKSIIPSAISLA